MGERRYNATNSSALVLDGVFSFKPQSLYTRGGGGNKTWCTVSRRLIGPQCRSKPFWGKHKSLVSGNQTMILQRPNLSLITIQTTLSRLYHKDIRRIYSNQFHIPQCLAAHCLQVKIYCKDNRGESGKMLCPFQNTIQIKAVKAYGIYVLCHVLVFM